MYLKFVGATGPKWTRLHHCPKPLWARWSDGSSLHQRNASFIVDHKTSETIPAVAFILQRN